MNYLKLLEDSAKERQSISCFGLDPDLPSLPLSFMPGASSEERITAYFSQIIDAALAEPRSIGAIKPNYAYFAQYGFEGLRSLKALIEKYKGKLPIILDTKRGDIGRSSEAYAKEVFGFWEADATTISPYMGSDSMEPFFKHCIAGKGVYVLCKTSNIGSHDFQTKIMENGKPLFLDVAKKIERSFIEGMGLVVGATEPDELETVMWDFYDSNKRLPLLVPGVGAQGASAKETAKILRTVWNDILPLHRINSSSAIAYAYKKKGSEDFVGAALSEIKRMNEEIGQI